MMIRPFNRILNVRRREEEVIHRWPTWMRRNRAWLLWMPRLLPQTPQ